MKTWEAVKALEEGKKIRRKHWDSHEFLYSNGRYVRDEENEFQSITISEDWEIYEPTYTVEFTEDEIRYLLNLLKKGSIGQTVTFDIWEKLNDVYNGRSK